MAAARKGEIQEARKIMERLVSMPPEPHKDMPKKRAVKKKTARKKER